MTLTRARPGAALSSPGDGTGARWPTWRGDLAFAAVTAALSALLVVRFLPGLMHGVLVDPDGYMRLMAEYGRVSVVHLLVGVIVLAFWRTAASPTGPASRAWRAGQQ